MKEEYTYIGCVLDHSGSMGQGGKIEEARNGFNVFLEEQQKLEGEADIRITIFDDKIETIYKGPVEKSPNLTRENFYPKGMTAYYDALGDTIITIGEELSNKPENERPSKVIILVITDGLENSSKEYSGYTIEEMIETQKNTYNWEFVFMGADESSIEDAKQFGIVNTVLYSNDSIGTRSAYETMSAMTTSYRNSGVVDFTQDIDDSSNED